MAKTVFGLMLWATAQLSVAATILYEGGATVVDRTLSDPTDLWVASTDLPRVNGFELKPEGACLDDICVPIRQEEDSDIYVTRQDVGWVNVTQLAARIQQPIVADYDTQTFSLGAIPVQRQGFVRDGIAPDFTLGDWQGDTFSLSDFKGKKIMLLSWASW